MVWEFDPCSLELAIINETTLSLKAKEVRYGRRRRHWYQPLATTTAALTNALHLFRANANLTTTQWYLLLSKLSGFPITLPREIVVQVPEFQLKIKIALQQGILTTVRQVWQTIMECLKPPVGDPTIWNWWLEKEVGIGWRYGQEIKWLDLETPLLGLPLLNCGVISKYLMA